LFDDLRRINAGGALQSAAGAGGALKQGFDEFIAEVDIPVHDLLQYQHLSSGIECGPFG
jgi:hypothetical protein